MPEIIPYKILSLKHQKIVEDLGCSIEFHSSYVRYRLKFFAIEPNNCEDLSLGEKDIERNYDCTFWYKNIASIEKEWLQEVQTWILVIQIDGMGGDARFHFKKESDCEALQDKFMTYVDAEFFKEENFKV